MTEVLAGTPTTGAPPATTYARARLRLGIAGVGTFTALAAVLLATGASSALLPDATTWAWSDPAWILLLVGLHAAVSAPFDVLGGRVLPVRHGRAPAGGGAGFARTWLRGVAAHAGILAVVALVLLAAGRAGGAPVVLAAAAAVMVVMLAAQVPVARLVGGVRREGDRLRADNPAFAGGIAGLPGRDRTLLSAAWDGPVARVQRARREAVRRSGSRALGVGVAVAGTLAGMALVMGLGAEVTSVAGVATLSLGMTLWSFLGLLVLPTPSRRAVLAADRAAVAGGVDPVELAGVLRALDAVGDDEPRRGRLVETVFHPVPSLERRLAALDAPDGPGLPQAWNAARTTLYLSWAGLGLVSRAVHCNSGRPALWVFLPGD
ncbi:hypothetical protein [Miltoncostaea oceani]|uniref:hypothetical protein n=1 Tax=Miltoncostaea oceani TaxID=2843216 RepID=UPI001C3D7DEA|nr:hypothetical protein [Miltoncostaea oceani]